MAITQPEAIQFSDRHLRPGSDKTIQLYNWAKMTVDDWTANNHQQWFPNDATEVLRDGASPIDDNGTNGDGRKVINGLYVQQLIATLNAYITWCDDNNRQHYNNASRVATNLTAQP